MHELPQPVLSSLVLGSYFGTLVSRHVHMQRLQLVLERNGPCLVLAVSGDGSVSLAKSFVVAFAFGGKHPVLLVQHGALADKLVVPTPTKTLWCPEFQSTHAVLLSSLVDSVADAHRFGKTAFELLVVSPFVPGGFVLVIGVIVDVQRRADIDKFRKGDILLHDSGGRVQCRVHAAHASVGELGRC